MNFQKLVVTIATVILIFMLLIIGYAMSKHNGIMKFPPSVSECPDYWVSSNNLCNNVNNLGDCNKSMNFKTNTYIGHKGDCNKVKWAKQCNVSWSGLTNDPKLNNC